MRVPHFTMKNPPLRKSCQLTFRIFLFCGCCFIFYEISLGLLTNFNNKKVIETVASAEIDRVNRVTEAPVLAICSKNPFRDSQRVMLTREDFLSNTLNVTGNILDSFYVTRLSNMYQNVNHDEVCVTFYYSSIVITSFEGVVLHQETVISHLSSTFYYSSIKICAGFLFQHFLLCPIRGRET